MIFVVKKETDSQMTENEDKKEESFEFDDDKQESQIRNSPLKTGDITQNSCKSPTRVRSPNHSNVSRNMKLSRSSENIDKKRSYIVRKTTD